MHYNSEDIARSTAKKLKEPFPSLPDVVEKQINGAEQEQLESTAKSWEVVAGIVAIASFILQLADFIINRIEKEKDKYEKLSASEKKEKIVLIATRDFKSSYDIDDEIRNQIIDIQAEEIVE